MKIIGVTGGIGAGKSTVCNELEKLGAAVIDADKIAREVLLPSGAAYSETVEFFGKEILLGSGEIDRKRLADIVFSSKDKLEMLNKITHKHILFEMKRQIDEANDRVIVLDVPLLFSEDFEIECDLRLAVLADEAVRIERVMKRDDAALNEVMARIKNQMRDEEYRKMADICIINDDFEAMKEQVRKIYESV